MSIFIEGYLHNVGATNHKESKTFYFSGLCYRSLRKSEPPHKIRLAISTEQPYDVSFGFCTHTVGLMYLVSHYFMTKAKMVHDDLHVNLKYNEWKISGSQSIAIAVQMTLSVIAVRQLIFQFSIEKQYPTRVYQIETFFSEENWLIFVEFKGKDAWEAAIFPATAQVKHGQSVPSNGCYRKASLWWNRRHVCNRSIHRISLCISLHSQILNQSLISY